jgi:hypothetical protein
MISLAARVPVLERTSAYLTRRRHTHEKRQTAMPNKTWLTQKEIAEMFDVPLSKLYPRISALRKAGVIDTRPDPDDDRVILVSSDSLEVIRRALGRDGSI